MLKKLTFYSGVRPIVHDI